LDTNASSSARKQVRLLHIVESLNIGAVENWLVRSFQTSRHRYPDYHWTFFCALGARGRLDDRVRELGGEVIYATHPIGQERLFMQNLRSVLKAGRYDVLHTHHDLVNAVYLLAAAGLPIQRRIVHVHNTDEGLPTPSRMKTFLFKEPMRHTCLQLADRIVGVSTEALTKFTGAPATPARDSVIHYGVDTLPFRANIETRTQFRESIGVDKDARILLFTGRMVTLKNPEFVVSVLAELAIVDPEVVAVFVGIGDLESRVSELARTLGIESRVKILGWRDDTAAIMRQSDVLIFPRLEDSKEALGLVLVEAQAAGLPIVASMSVTPDAQIIRELFTVLPLAAGAKEWARAARESLFRQRMEPAECLRRIEQSSFSLDAGVDNLMALYSDLA
jgi:glycosyltransferase involved in cell wall biosynthesis